MRSLFLLILSLTTLASPQAFGQKNAIWIGGGIQSSKMTDLKYIQELILDSYPVEGKIISSFPAYTMGSFGFVNQLYPSIRLGAGYSYSATGGKSNYSDYSGYVTTLITSASHRAGGFASYSVIGGEWFEISVYGRIEVKYTLVDISSTLYALGASSFTANSYSSISPGGAAGLEFLFHLKDFSLGAEGGYEVDAPGKLTNRENKNELSDPNDRERVLTSDWSGWYVQLKFMIWLDF